MSRYATFEAQDVDGLDVPSETKEVLKLLGCLTDQKIHVSRKSTSDVRPVWTFKLPARFQGRQVAVALNTGKTTLYLKPSTPAGKSVEDSLSQIAKIEQRYPNPQGRSPPSFFQVNGVAPGLQPDTGIPLLRVTPHAGKAVDVLHLCLGMTQGPRDLDEGAETAQVNHGRQTEQNRRPISLEEFSANLDRRSEIGQIGEIAAMEFEALRLRELGCSDPSNYVHHVAIVDVAKGYDIESTWPGAERIIEVKTSTSMHADFFLSENERKTLASRPEKAWIYRVVISDTTESKVFPFSFSELPDLAFSTAVWRVSAKQQPAVASGK